MGPALSFCGLLCNFLLKTGHFEYVETLKIVIFSLPRVFFFMSLVVVVCVCFPQQILCDVFSLLAIV